MMGLRILLVQSPSVEGPASEIVAPLGLGIVAEAARRAGHTVELIDLNVIEAPFAALETALERLDPEVVGVGLRNIDPLANRRHSYLPLFAALLEKGESLGDIAGLPGTLARPRCGTTELVKGPIRTRLSEARLNVPRQWLPAFVAPYQGKSSYAPAAGVETKRGCPLGCSYCVYPALQGRRLRFRAPETIVAEVELLHREAGVAWVHFTDPVLNLPPEHFRELCLLLRSRKLPVRWTGFFRENTLTPADAELAVSAGCAAFQFSGDGTCDRTLARLRKGFTRDAILQAARTVAATEALTVYHFMVNVPGTDEAVVRDAADLVDRLHDIHEPRMNLGAIVFNNLRVYPGTPLARELADAGRLEPTASLLFPTYHDPAPFQDLRYELEERHQLRACRWLPQFGAEERSA